MVCLELEPRVAGWKAQMNQLSYGGTPILIRQTSYSFKFLQKLHFPAKGCFIALTTGWRIRSPPCESEEAI